MEYFLRHFNIIGNYGSKLHKQTKFQVSYIWQADDIPNISSSTMEACEIDTSMPMEQNSNTYLNEITNFQASTLDSPDTSFCASPDWPFPN
jgi:hypothetical protein